MTTSTTSSFAYDGNKADDAPPLEQELGDRPPIQRIARFDTVEIAVMKRYIARSFEENQALAAIPDRMRHDRDDWEDIHKFQGYISAAFFFLNVVHRLNGRGGWTDDTSAESLLIMAGACNKKAADRWRKTDTRDETQRTLDEKLFSVDLAGIHSIDIQFLFHNFSPPAQEDEFYLAWQLFCLELFAMTTMSRSARSKKYFTLKGMRLLVMNLVNDILEELISKLYNLGENFELEFGFAMVKKELGIADESDLDFCKQIEPMLLPAAIDAMKSERVFADALDRTKKLTRKIRNKNLALRIARDYYIADFFNARID